MSLERMVIMIRVIAEPIERKLKRKKLILELEKKIVVAKCEDDTGKVALYEAELMLLIMQDIVVY